MKGLGREELGRQEGAGLLGLGVGGYLSWRPVALGSTQGTLFKAEGLVIPAESSTETGKGLAGDGGPFSP